MVKTDHVTNYQGRHWGSVVQSCIATNLRGECGWLHETTLCSQTLRETEGSRPQTELTMNPLRLIVSVDFWFMMRMVSTRVGI